MWNEEFQLLDGSYSVSDIQDYFKHIIKRHEALTGDLPIGIYVTFRIKTGYCLQLLTLGTMKLLGSTKCKITKDENGKNVFHLEITEVVLVHCSIANNKYQQNLSVLYIFFPNKLFGQLLDIWFKNFVFLKAFNPEFLYIEVWFTDQSSKPLEIKDKTTLL